MINIKKISKKISEYISVELKFDKEKTEVIEYGIFGIIQMILSVFLVVIFGLIFNVIIEALIVSFTIALLRKSSGGAHASTPGWCAIIGTIISLIVPIVVNEICSLRNLIIVATIGFAFSYFLVWKLAPVDSLAKPIKKEAKRKRLKKQSLIIISAYLMIIVINIMVFIVYNNNKAIIYSLCIVFGMLWQVLSLTKAIHSLIENIDCFYNKFIN